MRLIVQPVAGGFELCARLGLVFTPSRKLAGRNSGAQSAPLSFFNGGKIVHAVLDGSPGAGAGIEPRDIIISINGARWDSVHSLIFSDRRSSEITAKTFVARYFAIAKFSVHVPPEPYRSLGAIAAEAANIIAARPVPDTTPYKNPRFDDLVQLLAQRGLLLTQRRRRR